MITDYLVNLILNHNCIYTEAGKHCFYYWKGKCYCGFREVRKIDDVEFCSSYGVDVLPGNLYEKKIYNHTDKMIYRVEDDIRVLNRYTKS